ncbi:hypothetical protein ACLB2K_060954 [Fragaria x ananassa]
MSTLFETKDEYSTRVYQNNRNIAFRSRASVDIIPIRFRWYKAYANYNPEMHRYDYDPAEPAILLRRKTLKLRLDGSVREKASGDEKTTMERFARYKRVIAGSPRVANKLRNKLGRYLHTTVGLDEDKDPSIIEQIMERLQAAVPDKVMEVQTAHMICRDTEETLYLHLDDLYYRAKLIPATESFIQALEDMSPPDDDELECSVCMEMFAQSKDSSITQLPCSHYYHRDCIVPWLQINHLCPTCRHPS